MSSNAVQYHPGGFDPAAPQGNRAECWDADAGTYTAWDRDGNELVTRPLTADERASLSPDVVVRPDPVTVDTATATDLRARFKRATTTAAKVALLGELLDALDPTD